MRHTLLKLSLLALVAAPAAARAASMDLITVKDNGKVYAYTVPASPTGTQFNTVIDTTYNIFSAVEMQYVPTTLNSASSGPDDVFFGTTVCDNSNDCSPGGISDLTAGMVLFGSPLFTFTSTTSNNVTTYFPTFTLTNSGTLSDLINGGTATYSVAAVVPAGPAPEPSSLILLGTGALGVVGAMRRRLFA